MLRRIIAFTLILSLLLIITGCKSNDKTANQVISVDLNGIPNNIDPQLAASSSEIIAATNCLEGLLRINKDGKIINGVIKSYTITNNNKKYTFSLRGGLVWHDGTPLT